MKNLYILLGSNQGDSRSVFQKAIQMLSIPFNAPITFSRLYSSPPWGFEADTNFLNQVLAFKTNMPAEAVLTECLATEQQLGRVRTGLAGYSSRIIDIDVLYYGPTVCQTATLDLPHPQLHNRRFTLLPLCDVAPDFVHPLLGKTNADLLAECCDMAEVVAI